MRPPVIAAINGAAVGVGATYPLSCGIRFAAEDAKIGFVFNRRGMLPELASHTNLRRVVGLSNAADLLMSGRIITGEEAAEMGLVSRAVPKIEVLDLALERAHDIAVNVAPVSVAVTKRRLWEGFAASTAEMQLKEQRVFAWFSRQPDSIEGVASFLEKRSPDWKLRRSVDFPDRLL
jgi:enoyl-CoA hydratase/carnithine racemase